MDADWTPLELEQLDRFFFFCLGDLKEGKCGVILRSDMAKVNWTQDTQMFEVLTPNLALKPYFDLEIEGLAVHEGLGAECDEKCELFLDWITIKLEQHTGVSLERTDFLVTNGSRLDKKGAFKLSYHVIVQKKLYFETMADHKIFAEHLWNGFMEWTRAPGEATDEDALLFEQTVWQNGGKMIMDRVVYSTNRLFKLPYQSKQGEAGSTQQVCEGFSAWTPVDMTVGLYFGVGDRVPVNVLPLKDIAQRSHASGQAPKKPRPSRASGGGGTVKKDWVTGTDVFEGRTLQEFHGLSNDTLIKMPRYKMYLYLIPNGDKVGYDEWLNVGFALKSCGAPFKLWDDWSAFYSKHVKGSEEKNYNSMTEPKLDIRYLRRLAKRNCAARATKAKKSIFSSEAPLLDDYLRVDTQGISVINETSTYLSSGDDAANLLLHQKHMIYSAPMGIGKTQAIKQILRQRTEDGAELLYPKVLFLSTRISFANYITGTDFAELGLVNYKDGNDSFVAERLVVSLESLSFVRVETYDIIILDECESVLKLFSSETMKEHGQTAYKKLRGYIKSAKKVIWADAFIMNRTLDFVRSFGTLWDTDREIAVENPAEAAVMIVNTTPTAQPRVRTEIYEDGLRDKVEELVKQGKKLYVVSGSLAIADTVITSLKDERRKRPCETLDSLFDEPIHFGPDGSLSYPHRLIYYSSKMSDKHNTETLQHINEAWFKAQMVVCTPKITVGCSYGLNPSSFDTTIIFFKPTCCVRDLIQTHMRVRHTGSTEVLYSTPDDKKLAALNWMDPQQIYDTFEYFLSAELERNEIEVKERLDAVNGPCTGTAGAWLGVTCAVVGGVSRVTYCTVTRNS